MSYSGVGVKLKQESTSIYSHIYSLGFCIMHVVLGFCIMHVVRVTCNVVSSNIEDAKSYNIVHSTSIVIG